MQVFVHINSVVTENVARMMYIYPPPPSVCIMYDLYLYLVHVVVIVGNQAT